MTRIKMFLYGNVVVSICIESFPRFLTACNHRGIHLFDVTQEKEKACFRVSVKELYALHPLFRKFKMQIRIVSRRGLPFLMHSAKKNWSYWLGLLFCFLLLQVSSQYIWKIEFVGNNYYTDSTLISYLGRWGHHTGMSVSEVEEETLELLIRNSFPNITWVSVTQSGTGLYIAVKEEFAKEVEEELPLECWDLVAEESGIISSIVTRNGVALVKEGDSVEKGQILVSGILPLKDDAGIVMENRYVEADADIFLFQTVPYDNKTPLRYTVKEPVRVIKRYEIGVMGQFVPLYLRRAGTEDMIFCRERNLVFHDFLMLPVAIRENSIIRYVEAEKKRTEEEGIMLEEEHLSTYLCKIEKMGVQIIEKNVNIGVTGNYSFAEGSISIVKKAGTRQRIEKVEPIGEHTD